MKLFFSALSSTPQGHAALKKLATAMMSKDKAGRKAAITELVKIGVAAPRCALVMET